MESDTVKTAVALRLISIISNSNQPESEVIFPFTAVGILSFFHGQDQRGTLRAVKLKISPAEIKKVNR